MKQRAVKSKNNNYLNAITFLKIFINLPCRQVLNMKELIHNHKIVLLLVLQVRSYTLELLIERDTIQRWLRIR